MNKKYLLIILIAVVAAAAFSYAAMTYKTLATVPQAPLQPAPATKAKLPPAKPTAAKVTPEAQARAIANGGECRKNGIIGSLLSDNNNGSWVFEVNRYSDTQCMSVCLVDLAAKSSKPNYMCTGLLPEQTPAQ